MCCPKWRHSHPGAVMTNTRSLSVEFASVFDKHADIDRRIY
jgi:hypothetical protein